MSSPKETVLNKRIMEKTRGIVRKVAEVLITDPEIQYLQEYANTVSIKRLGYNDHGPVHMRTVALNALTMADILHEAGIALSIEQDEAGSFEDSRIALLLASFLHDVGMTVGRADHEHTSAIIALPIIDRVLMSVYADAMEKRVIVRSTAMECIVGHMATQKIHSLEAGLILIADGCDMEKGRARIPMMLNTESRVGDIHKYSASPSRMSAREGERKPIKSPGRCPPRSGSTRSRRCSSRRSTKPVNEYIESTLWSELGFKCYSKAAG
jgi:metal-dependent HD superfamily phosphatase/phosphodiesterase